MNDRAGLEQISCECYEDIKTNFAFSAVKSLERAGLIEHKRGTVRILDRVGMEDLTCDCYEAVKVYFEETMGFSL